MRVLDLRSDTVTLPTDEMRQAMAWAEVGDDVYGDDPTVLQLEKTAAAMVGKEAALFVPSGTFGNQLALLTHCNRGDEVLLADDCHIVQHEVGAASVIAGVHLRTLMSDKGELKPDEILQRIRIENLHYPQTGLICIENAHSNGRVVSLRNMHEIYEIGRKHGIPVHLDGARIFNASVYLGVEAAEIAGFSDSVMFCLSKGLCAPVGSILAGKREFIDKARKGRKLMGGGLRQAGVLAAAGIIALEKMSKRLSVDHQNASLLAEKLTSIPGVRVFMDDVQINMVFFDIKETGYEPEKLVNELLKRGIKINPPENGIFRLVTHYWVDPEDVHFVADTIGQILLSLS